MNLICFSHLRWDFVYQRPQHLMSRFAKTCSVYFVEEADFTEEEDGCNVVATPEGVLVIRPHLHASDAFDINRRLETVLDLLLAEQHIRQFVFWYYTPMALEFTQSFLPQVTIYDCMDELTGFKFASPFLKRLEEQLLKRADLVFTGGRSLYEAKKDQHELVYLFPSSIDKSHFGSARSISLSPPDQQSIAGPRLGFFGVIDERFDIELLRESAELRPDWSFVMIGPIIKIDIESLPKNKNIHYLGMKKYHELPAYLSGWDIALIPFAMNDSTRYISPTKTPEYLAAGIPVISTPIVDVVEPYGSLGLVSIIDSAEKLVKRGSDILNYLDKEKWLKKVDQHLAHQSWDLTWASMNERIHAVRNKEMISK